MCFVEECIAEVDSILAAKLVRMHHRFVDEGGESGGSGSGKGALTNSVRNIASSAI